MHDILSVIVLSILQGLTEFLPVSSSGHLVIAGRLLHFESPGIHLELMLHFGTCISICIFFRRQLADLGHGLWLRDRVSRRKVGLLLLADVPAVLFFLLAGKWIGGRFEDPRMTAVFLMVTGLVLLSTFFLNCAGRPMNRRRALLVGLAQSLALLPGISRSGLTIVTARHLGVDAREAAEFSLLMSLPLLIGGMLLTFSRHSVLAGAGNPSWHLALLGLPISAGVGWVAIKLLMRALNGRRIWCFGVYCLGMGALLWALL